VQPAPALLEEGHDRVQRLDGANPEAGVVAPARGRPAAVAVLAAGGERDDVGPPHGAAAAPEGDVEREQDLMESGAHRGTSILAVRWNGGAFWRWGWEGDEARIEPRARGRVDGSKPTLKANPTEDAG
jgi:hypothetical protein